jgi:hypothetical protein
MLFPRVRECMFIKGKKLLPKKGRVFKLFFIAQNFTIH